VSDMMVFPYSSKDEAAALRLEDKCIQGTSLQLKFRRPHFRARSELYENYRIYCARRGGEVIGIIAGALKEAELHGRDIRALYVYDLRVHPAHRKTGVGKRLADVLIDDLGRNADCIYTLINGQNEKALGLARRYFLPEVIIPLTYALIPVYKERREKTLWKFSGAAENHDAYLRQNPDLEFLPAFNRRRLTGHVASLMLESPERAGCSVWTNEDILAEQVIRLPSFLRALGMANRLLGRWFRLPHIPAQGEIIRSWFLFDLWADDAQSLAGLLAVVNNQALADRRSYLYILLRENDRLLMRLRGSGLKVFSLPYLFLAKGQSMPRETDAIHIDIRDL
jgi:ribosomal protein S18 acetylase RimI-like enzyme